MRPVAFGCARSSGSGRIAARTRGIKLLHQGHELGRFDLSSAELIPEKGSRNLFELVGGSYPAKASKA